jgi:hypothetical protein
MAAVAGTWSAAGLIRNGGADRVGKAHGTTLTLSLASSANLAPLSGSLQLQNI